MRQDDAEHIDRPEERASEQASRRRFLIGGAMAAVGALAAAGVPKAAEGQPACPGGGQAVGVREQQDGTSVPPIDYSPNDTLAKMIVNAWAIPEYKDALLRGDLGTLSLFRQEGFTHQDVKVLTYADYCTGHTRLTRNQAIYVLPDRPPGLNIAIELARNRMAVTPFGM